LYQEQNPRVLNTKSGKQRERGGNGCCGRGGGVKDSDNSLDALLTIPRKRRMMAREQPWGKRSVQFIYNNGNDNVGVRSNRGLEEVTRTRGVERNKRNPLRGSAVGLPQLACDRACDEGGGGLR